MRVEPELCNKIGTGIVFRGLQDIVVEARNMRHKGKLVGGVGLGGMRAVCRILPIKCRSAPPRRRSTADERPHSPPIIGG